MLRGLGPGGAALALTAKTAATLLRLIPPGSPAESTREDLAQDLVRERPGVDASLADIKQRLTVGLDERGARDLAIGGIGAVTAVPLTGRTGVASRVASEHAVATLAGVAPSNRQRRHNLHPTCARRDRGVTMVIIHIDRVQPGAPRLQDSEGGTDMDFPTLTSEQVDEVLGGFHIIDADSHFTEPTDLWSSRVPKGYQGRVPVHKTMNGRSDWYFGGELWSGIGGNVLTHGHDLVRGQHIVQPFEAVDPAAWDVGKRLALLDELGIYAQVLYPNGVGFSSNHIFAIENTEERAVVLQIYNDFYVDIQEESAGRLFPQAMLPIWNMDLTVKEMARLVDRGITGFTLSDKPELLGLPELADPYFDPMWDMFNETGTVTNFHIGAGNRREDQEALRASITRALPGQAGTQVDGEPEPAATLTQGSGLVPAWSSFPAQRALCVLGAQLQMSNMRIISNMCMSNLFDRFPNLKVVSAESGIGWIPFLLENLEHHVDQMLTDRASFEFATRRPTEYFRDHFSVMFWFEKLAPAKLIEDIGVKNVMVETDIPHPTCLYPKPRDHFARVLQSVEPHVRRRVLQDNAAELYKIPLPAVAGT